MLVNFMSHFDQVNVNSIKRKILAELNFVGSIASHHRKMSEGEKRRFEGEDWVMNETWVLARHEGGW
jgi:hypothetical protein